MKAIKNKKLSLKGRKELYGWIFVAPWVVGFLILFLKPLISSLWYSFSNLQVTVEGIKTEFVKLQHWNYIFLENPGYTDNLSSAISSFVLSLPIIVFLSVCIAIILNQKFRGRLLARAIFFIPAIMASGVVMGLFSTTTASMSGAGETNYFTGAIDFGSIISGLGLPESVTGILSSYVTQISSLIWSSGVQIILVLSGLQSISPQLYEVAKIEGANAWETFWFITFPMLSNILLVVVLYTTIDLFTNSDNPVMSNAYYLILERQNYSESSAMLWAYFLIVGVILAAILFLMDKFMLKKWND